MIHSHSVQGVIDFQCGPGYVAEAALLQRVPYVGWCHTEAHVQCCRRYIFARLWAFMQNPGSEYHNVELAALTHVCNVEREWGHMR